MLSARGPGSLPSPDLLRRRCEALARLDHALDPDPIDLPMFDFSRGVFWTRESEGNYVQISFVRSGVLVVGFDHESPMSPVHNGERTWPGVVDDVPRPLRRTLAGYPYGVDITFCIWRLAGSRRWQSGSVRRPRGRDVDGSARLLAILDGDPRRFRAYAREVFERDIPLAAIARAYAGKSFDLAAKPAKPAIVAKPAGVPKFRVGDRVSRRGEDHGKVTGVVYGLAAAEAVGLTATAKTPRRGIYYTMRPDTGGEAILAEHELRRVSRRA